MNAIHKMTTQKKRQPPRTWLARSLTAKQFSWVDIAIMAVLAAIFRIFFEAVVAAVT